MKKPTKIVLAVLIIGVIIFVAFKLTGNAPDGPGKYDDFAKCLTDNGVVMYGAYWCPHCLNQKKAFGKSFDYINYVECDPRGDNARPQLCEEKGVEGYPTWEFSGGDKVSGELSFNELAFRSNCSLGGSQ